MKGPSVQETPLQRLIAEAFRRRVKALNYHGQMIVTYNPFEEHELECWYKYVIGGAFAFEVVLWTMPDGTGELEVRKLNKLEFRKALFRAALDFSSLFQNATSIGLLRKRAKRLVDVFEETLQDVFLYETSSQLGPSLERLWAAYLEHLPSSPSPRPTDNRPSPRQAA